VYSTVGGGAYQHKVWNYSKDSVLLRDTFLGIPYRAVTYYIDRRPTSQDHELIMLTPIKRWTGIWAILSLFLDGNKLERLSLNRGKFLRLETHSKNGIQISTGKPGNYAKATVSAQIDNTLSTTAEISKFDLNMAQVQSIASCDKEAAAILTQYHRSTVPMKPDIVQPVCPSVNRYQFSLADYDPVAKPMVVPFMNPIITGACAPYLTVMNEREMVKGRINDVKTNTPVTNTLAKMMKEFVNLLVPNRHQGIPVDVEEVYTRQNRPAQRRILEQADAMTAGLKERVLQVFC